MTAEGATDPDQGNLLQSSKFTIDGLIKVGMKKPIEHCFYCQGARTLETSYSSLVKENGYFHQTPRFGRVRLYCNRE